MYASWFTYVCMMQLYMCDVFMYVFFVWIEREYFVAIVTGYGVGVTISGRTDVRYIMITITKRLPP